MYGGYYNWTAATAGTGTSAFTSGDTTNSICPKNWSLPSQVNFETLVSKYPGLTLLNPPTNMVRAGITVTNCDVFNCQQGGGSYYWSSTASAYNFAYRLITDATDDSFYVNYGGGGKVSGLSVRCISR